MRFGNAEGIATTSSVLRHQEGSASKIQVACPDTIKNTTKNLVGFIWLIKEQPHIIWIINSFLLAHFFRLYGCSLC